MSNDEWLNLPEDERVEWEAYELRRSWWIDELLESMGEVTKAGNAINVAAYLMMLEKV